MINVLFVCTGNSCRSQMAEGWLRALAGDRIQADSAGIEVHGRIEHAVAAMAQPLPRGTTPRTSASRHARRELPR